MCKRSEFPLFRTFKKIVMDKNIDFTRKDIPNNLMIFGSDKNNGGIPPFGGKRSCLKRIRGYNAGEEGGGSRHSFAR